MNGEVAFETDYPVLATRRKSLYNLVAAGTRTALQCGTVLPTAATTGLSKKTGRSPAMFGVVVAVAVVVAMAVHRG